jgi:CcmD family protein
MGTVMMNRFHDLMRRTRMIVMAIAALLLVVAPAWAQTPQNEFVPMKAGEVEPLPAAPLVFFAYAFVWGALILYVFVLWRRINKVERELADLNGRLQSAKRA